MQPEPSAANRSFFTELLASMSDLKFSRDGNCMLARDFMGLKLWDIRYESGPLATYPIHEHLKGKVGPKWHLSQPSAPQSSRGPSALRPGVYACAALSSNSDL